MSRKKINNSIMSKFYREWHGDFDHGFQMIDRNLFIAKNPVTEWWEIGIGELYCYTEKMYHKSYKRLETAVRKAYYYYNHGRWDKSQANYTKAWMYDDAYKRYYNSIEDYAFIEKIYGTSYYRIIVTRVNTPYGNFPYEYTHSILCVADSLSEAKDYANEYIEKELRKIK